ncbi:hypothetical protein HPP92_024871 [Vanilla planifolia]|uniref:IST1-like protein n=1 Tax=Vanilla planifolia TaxID=51239 RepID=A0A835PPV8_VANPL|nr:hypothetical protein HPP92_024871 [Vanilla planifolia]
MLDSFFSKGFKAARCKTMLKLTIPRIKLLRNRREIQLKQMRKDIANLLENGQEATARIRVEHIIREENMMAAQEIIELFCELIVVRLPIIEAQRECPLDLKEAISSLCFAAPRCADLPELLQVQLLFASKYGKEFVAAATELMPDCGVNRQIIELLSVRPPSVESKLKLLKEIAEEHEVDWDSVETETEFLKPHEDLLNGPNNMSGSSMLPFPEEKPIGSSKDDKHEPEEDDDFGLWDLPQVPKVSVRANQDESPGSPVAILRPPPPPPAINYSEIEQEEAKVPPLDTMDLELETPNGNVPIASTGNKQFIPFVSPPSSLLPTKSEANSNLQEDVFPSVHATKPAEPHPLHPEANTTDLQDVLAAAQAAAETAERAATAARAAASLAQVRISELSRNKKSQVSDGFEAVKDAENPTWKQSCSCGDAKQAPSWDSGSPTLTSQEPPETETGPPDRIDGIRNPQRSVSMEEDPYFSYPNLFSRQDSGLQYSFSTAENSRK